MKKRCLVSVLFVFLGFLVFGDTAEQEEVDHLLFLPDSGSLLVNEEQAMVQLDNLAKYLRSRDLIPGQIHVYGYAALAVNDIEPVSLSKDRAFWVINELQKRGVSQELFSDPVGLGSVDLWGNNADEESKSPNRRVRVVLDGNVLTPQTLKAAEPEIPIANIDNNENVEAPTMQESATDVSKPFPWWLLLLPLLAILFFLLKKKKGADGKVAKPRKDAEPAPVPVSSPQAASKTVKPTAASAITVNLEEEIRLRAYELYLRRYGQSENAYDDWCRAVAEISAQYAADGYQVYRENENWWARKSTHLSF